MMHGTMSLKYIFIYFRR